MCCRPAGQGALCGTAFQVSYRQECDCIHGLWLGPALTRPISCMQQAACMRSRQRCISHRARTFACSFLPCQPHSCCYDVACRDCSAAPPWFIFRAATSFSRWLRMLPRKLEPAPIAMLAELNGMMSSQLVRTLSLALTSRPFGKGRMTVLHSGEPHLGVMRHVVA